VVHFVSGYPSVLGHCWLGNRNSIWRVKDPSSCFSSAPNLLLRRPRRVVA